MRTSNLIAFETAVRAGALDRYFAAWWKAGDGSYADILESVNERGKGVPNNSIDAL